VRGLRDRGLPELRRRKLQRALAVLVRRQRSLVLRLRLPRRLVRLPVLVPLHQLSAGVLGWLSPGTALVPALAVLAGVAGSGTT
jgi:hypothetical protein